MSNLVEFDSLANDRKAITKPVRLEGEGWFLEVMPIDNGKGVSVRCGGDSLRLVVLPDCANQVSIYSDRGRDQRVHEDAVKVFEVWKSDETSPMRKKGNK